MFERRLQAIARDDIHWDAEDLGRSRLHPPERKQADVGSDVDQEIHVAAGPIVSASDTAEQPDVGRTECLEERR